MHSDKQVVIDGQVLTPEQAWVVHQALRSLNAQVGNVLRLGAENKPVATKIEDLCGEVLWLFDKQPEANK
ncbi:hypothetical protein [Methylobacterium currus]|uniref:hypothetical protein n=1 Tax=Methylobacterium currus TaxID=2051553 RepID=UPI000F4F8A2D|nr:hypothetical protein [Methylobacterium currus]